MSKPRQFTPPVQQARFNGQADFGLLTELLIRYHEYQRPDDLTGASMADFHRVVSFIGDLAIVNPPIYEIYPSRARGIRRIYQAPSSRFGRFLLKAFPPGHTIWNHVRMTRTDEPIPT